MAFSLLCSGDVFELHPRSEEGLEQCGLKASDGKRMKGGGPDVDMMGQAWTGKIKKTEHKSGSISSVGP